MRTKGALLVTGGVMTFVLVSVMVFLPGSGEPLQELQLQGQLLNGGGPGEPCCAGNTCTQGNRCNNGFCEPISWDCCEVSTDGTLAGCLPSSPNYCSSNVYNCPQHPELGQTSTCVFRQEGGAYKGMCVHTGAGECNFPSWWPPKMRNCGGYGSSSSDGMYVNSTSLVPGYVWSAYGGICSVEMCSCLDAGGSGPPGPDPNVGPGCSLCGNGNLDNGEQCDDGDVQSGDGCSSVCETESQLCGNGVLDPGEQCDNVGGSFGACCNQSNCQFEVSGTLCRPGNGLCDLAETCTGASVQCPADQFKTAGTSCRGSAGACDIAETCPGGNPNCPSDALLPSNTVCAAAAPPSGGPPPGNGKHKVNCTGSSVTCGLPANEAPVLPVIGNQSTVRGVSATLALSATDGDIDSLYYIAGPLPPGMTVQQNPAMITGIPSTTGTYPITVTVTDGHGGSAQQSFTWNITNPPQSSSAASSVAPSSSSAAAASSSFRSSSAAVSSSSRASSSAASSSIQISSSARSSSSRQASSSAASTSSAGICGNGILTATEQCDDRNIVNGDGCSSQCRVEQGYGCRSIASDTQPVECNGQPVPLISCAGGKVVCQRYAGVAAGGGRLEAWSMRCPVSSGSSSSAAPVQLEASCMILCGDNVKKASEKCDAGSICKGAGDSPIIDTAGYHACVAAGGTPTDVPGDGCAACSCMDGKGFHLPLDVDQGGVTPDTSVYRFDGKFGAYAADAQGASPVIDDAQHAPLTFYLNPSENKSLKFDGNDMVTTQFPFASSPFTYSFWIRPLGCVPDTSLTGPGSYAWTDLFVSTFIWDVFSIELLRLGGNSCALNIFSPQGSVVIGGSVLNNQWNNVIITYDGTVTMFLNGAVVAQRTYAAPTIRDWLSLGWVSIPNRDSGFKGWMDDVRGWSRKLTPEERQDIVAGREPPEIDEACLQTTSAASSASAASASSAAPQNYIGCCNIATGEFIVGAQGDFSPVSWDSFKAGNVSLIRPMSLVTSCLATPKALRVSWDQPQSDVLFMYSLCKALGPAPATP